MAGLAGLMFCACSTNSEDEHHFDNKLYINTSTASEDILFKASTETATESRQLTIAVPIPVEQEVSGKFVFDPSRTAVYNMAYGAEAETLPSEMLSIEEPVATINAGASESAPVTVVFSGIEALDRDKVYVAPVSLVDVQGIDVLDSKTIVYYVFKGAALINVVADIRENYFPINWSSDVSRLNAVTVEALIRVRNFDVQDGKSEGISTVFGIEGGFLVRIGDAQVEKNQIQLCNPNGSFPSRNPDYGLPTDEWVHIAVVWDGTTGDRIIYHNGQKIVSDTNASGTVSLSSNCYIGRSWNDQRWLDGEISEVRIWSRQRTQDELNALNAFYTVDPDSEGLIAYWKFDEGSGKTIKDYSGNGNDIEAANDLTWTRVSLPE